MNRTVFALVAILCLLSVSSIVGLIHGVKASVALSINADGSVSGSTASIYSADNVTYTLTGNVTAIDEGILIFRDNIVLNGAGHSVLGSGIADSSGIQTGTSISNMTVRNVTITNFAVGIVLHSSSNCTLSGNKVTANSNNGIVLEYSSNNNTLAGNIVTANSNDGILLNSSSDNTLSGNDVANNQPGIEVAYSSGNTLSGNTVTANNAYDGIHLYFSSNNVLSGNNVTANPVWGILLDSSSNNTLSGNTFANSSTGIALASSSNNTIYHNNFINNTAQVTSNNSTNAWDNGSSGNYWSDYQTKYPNAAQVDSSGVWNTPYVIDTDNTDHYPLMVPYATVPEFPSSLVLSLFMIATLLAVIIYKKTASKKTTMTKTKTK